MLRCRLYKGLLGLRLLAFTRVYAASFGVHIPAGGGLDAFTWICTCGSGAIPGTQVHSGFWEGAKQHIEDIKQVVQRQNRQAPQQLPVWITGHSLGGGYANCMMLQLLANKRTAEIFSTGESLLSATVIAWQQPPCTVVMLGELAALNWRLLCRDEPTAVSTVNKR